jgi:hypothetical protein
MSLKDIYIRLIPSEIRRLRHIVAEGLLLRYLVKRKKYLGKSLRPDKFPYYLTIAAIVRNEAPYIVEWIEYHLLLGVEKIYLYDNESDDNLKEVLAPYIEDGLVEYIFWPDKGLRPSENSSLLRKRDYKLWLHWFVNKIQVPAYEDAIKRLVDTAYWIGFIDIDEFIVPTIKNTISETLADFEDLPGVAINWLTYGHGGHIEKTDGMVIERFKSHSDPNLPFNSHTKVILNPRHILKMVDVHHAKSIDDRNIVNTRGEEIETYCMDYPPCHDKMRINHYWMKSFAEYLSRRRNDGGGGTASHQQLLNEFVKNQEEYNTVPYDGIMDKYISVLKERIKKRFTC